MAPSAADPHAGFTRARHDYVIARRQMDIATGARDCAAACKALDSMRRAAAEVCELSRGGEDEERAWCRQVQGELDRAIDRVRSACGACSSGGR